MIVRRIPELNTTKLAAAQDCLFGVYRYHAFFTTVETDVLGTVAADKLHRQHAIVEQVFADLKAGPLAHMPSGTFQANAAWLVTAAITHNLLRATAILAGGQLAKARTVSLRQKIINIPRPNRSPGPPLHPASAHSLEMGARLHPAMEYSAESTTSSTVVTISSSTQDTRPGTEALPGKTLSGHNGCKAEDSSDPKPINHRIAKLLPSQTHPHHSSVDSG